MPLCLPLPARVAACHPGCLYMSSRWPTPCSEPRRSILSCPPLARLLPASQLPAKCLPACTLATRACDTPCRHPARPHSLFPSACSLRGTCCPLYTHPKPLITLAPSGVAPSPTRHLTPAPARPPAHAGAREPKLGRARGAPQPDAGAPHPPSHQHLVTSLLPMKPPAKRPPDMECGQCPYFRQVYHTHTLPHVCPAATSASRRTKRNRIDRPPLIFRRLDGTRQDAAIPRGPTAQHHPAQPHLRVVPQGRPRRGAAWAVGALCVPHQVCL